VINTKVTFPEWRYEAKQYTVYPGKPGKIQSHCFTMHTKGQNIFENLAANKYFATRIGGSVFSGTLLQTGREKIKYKREIATLLMLIFTSSDVVCHFPIAIRN
jgi:hypothetical protein